MADQSGKYIKILQPGKFKHGEDFRQFCERFKQYVQLGHIEDSNLHLIFLSFVDTRTYTKLSAVKIEDADKKVAEKFCEIYIENYYPTKMNPI